MVVAPGLMIDSFLSIPDAESLPLYRMVLQLACVAHIAFDCIRRVGLATGYGITVTTLRFEVGSSQNNKLQLGFVKKQRVRSLGESPRHHPRGQEIDHLQSQTHG
jgi:hypothetical protein